MKKSLILISFFLATGLAIRSGDPTLQAGPPARPSSPSTALNVQPDFGRLPLFFIPNRGQADEPIDYYIPGKDKTIYFTPGGLTLALTSPGPGALDSPTLGRESRRRIEAARPGRRHILKLDFIGANPGVHPRGEAMTGAAVSYFRGTPDRWQSGLPTFTRIVYPDLWPGIDLSYSGTSGRLKYEFVVRPGADPSLIRLAYRGTEDVEVDRDGRLAVRTAAGSFRDDVPAAHQDGDSGRAVVSVKYRLETPLQDRTFRYGFEVGEYDRTKTLVLDPAVLVYCGFIGGGGDESASGIAVDGGGNAYVTGFTTSDEASFPVEAGPDLEHNLNSDAFIAKVNGAGSGLVYCGYIGGAGDDYALGIALDGSGNAYVVGNTFSNELSFPVTSGPDTTYNDWSSESYGDAFVAKVNSSGSQLVYCGYIGGIDVDAATGIAVDGAGNAYVTGETSSRQGTGLFPVGIGPDLTHNGNADAFVAKVEPSGESLVYCGYIGGTDNDRSMSIVVDKSGGAYLAGYTESVQTTFPEKAGPDLTHNGGADAFVAKVTPSGDSLVYCGYIGGSMSDEARGIAVDGNGNAYVTGSTASPDSSFPVAVGPDLTHVGEGFNDGFVAKVNPSGTGLVYCGYIGGSGHDFGQGIAVDIAGNAYIAGYAGSTEATFPVSIGPDLTHNGNYDAFVAKVNPGGTGFVYSGFVGGFSADVATSIAVDKTGNVFIAGETNSPELTFPVAVGPDLSFNGFPRDAFVAKISCPDKVMISGEVSAGGSPLSGVVMSGLLDDPQTDASGAYAAEVDSGWWGTVSPNKAGYTFTPASRSYSGITSHQTDQDYAAALLMLTVSGWAKTGGGTAISGVVMGGLPGNPLTDASGQYTGTVPYGWSGTVTPAKSGYTFAPATRSYANVTANQTSQNYTGSGGYTKPTVTTAAVTSIGTTTAVSGGNVTSDGGAAVTDRGVCWSVSSGPTIADPRTHDGAGTGSYVSQLAGLNANATYFVRAYATNSAGTSYGNQVEFKTLATPPNADHVAVLKNNGGLDNNLFVYTAPIEVQKGALKGTDPWSGDGNTVAMAGGNFDGKGGDEIAYLKEVAAPDFTLFVYTAPAGAQKGTLIGTDYLSYDGAPIALAAVDIDGDGRDEIAVLKKAGPTDYNLYVFTAPTGVQKGVLKGGDWWSYDGNTVAIAGGDFDGDKVDDIAVLKQPGSNDFTVQIVAAPQGIQRGALKGTDKWSADGNTVAMAGVDNDGDGVAEVAILKKAGATDFNLSVYSARIGAQGGRFKGADWWSYDGQSRKITGVKGL
jgi:hypothetical protein